MAARWWSSCGRGTRVRSARGRSLSRLNSIHGWASSACTVARRSKPCRLRCDRYSPHMHRVMIDDVCVRACGQAGVLRHRHAVALAEVAQPAATATPVDARPTTQHPINPFTLAHMASVTPVCRVKPQTCTPFRIAVHPTSSRLPCRRHDHHCPSLALTHPSAGLPPAHLPRCCVAGPTLWIPARRRIPTTRLQD